MIVRRTAIASILAASALVIAGCGMMNKVQGVMTVPLSGQNEVPPNLSGGSGTGKVQRRVLRLREEEKAKAPRSV